MGTGPRRLGIGIGIVVLLVALSGGILLTGAVAADGDAKDGAATNESDTGETLEDVQVGTLELANVTVENATIEKLRVGEVHVERGANALAAVGAADRADEAIELSDLAIPSFELGNVSATDLAVADEQGTAQTLTDDDADEVVVRNLTIEAMTVTQLTVEQLAVTDRAGGASERTPASENAKGAPHDTDADREATTREIAGLTVERVDVKAITVETLAVALGQGPADAPPAEPGSAADDRKSTDDCADDEGATAEHEGKTISRVAISSMTVETATTDSVAVSDLRGAQAGGSDDRDDGSHGG